MSSLLSPLSGNSPEQHSLLSVKVEGDHPRISINRLSRISSSGQTILDNCSLDISAGQIVGLIGPSGSGKSTLLRAVNRLWEPEAGTIFVDGKDITKESVISVRKRIGMLFQTAALFDGTVKDNVSYGPSLSGTILSEAQVADLLQLANLDPSFAAKPCIGLSGGQAQRVALARTLANNPEVLLLDEPTSALDPSATLRVEETILNLRKTTGLTVLWVSHSIEQVERVADVAVLLVKGQIVDICTPQELRNSGHPLAQQFIAGKLDSTL